MDFVAIGVQLDDTTRAISAVSATNCVWAETSSRAGEQSSAEFGSNSEPDEQQNGRALVVHPDEDVRVYVCRGGYAFHPL